MDSINQTELPIFDESERSWHSTALLEFDMDWVYNEDEEPYGHLTIRMGLDPWMYFERRYMDDSEWDAFEDGYAKMAALDVNPWVEVARMAAYVQGLSIVGCHLDLAYISSNDVFPEGAQVNEALEPLDELVSKLVDDLIDRTIAKGKE